MKLDHIRYKSLVSWINPNSSEQASWIAKSFINKDRGHFVSNYTSQETSPNNLISILSAHLGDAECREALREIRAAWRQKEFRDRNGKLVNFQVSQELSNDLSKIASDRAITKIQALRQLIKDNANKTTIDRSRTLKANKILREKLNKSYESKIDSEKIRNEIIKELQTILIHEIELNCRIRASLDFSDDQLIEITDEKVQALLKARANEVKENLPSMKLLRSGLNLINRLLP